MLQQKNIQLLQLVYVHYFLKYFKDLFVLQWFNGLDTSWSFTCGGNPIWQWLKPWQHGKELILLSSLPPQLFNITKFISW
jgi:hypothetical protein